MSALSTTRCHVSYGRTIDKSVEYNIIDENGQTVALARSDKV